VDTAGAAVEAGVVLAKLSEAGAAKEVAPKVGAAALDEVKVAPPPKEKAGFAAVVAPANVGTVEFGAVLPNESEGAAEVVVAPNPVPVRRDGCCAGAPPKEKDEVVAGAAAGTLAVDGIAVMVNPAEIFKAIRFHYGTNQHGNVFITYAENFRFPQILLKQL
jgi:hypothetical protein